MYIPETHRIDRGFPLDSPACCYCLGLRRRVLSFLFVSGFDRGARRRRGEPVPEYIDGEQRVKLAGFFVFVFYAILTGLELHP